MTDVETKPKKAPPLDLAAMLGTDEVPLDDLRKRVDDLTLARAWAAGDIEFGHAPYCITGPVAKMNSVLVVEDGKTEWSGPKTKLHKNFRDLVLESPPVTEKWKRYQVVPATIHGEEPQLKPVEISKDAALAAIAIKVRLTDKGLGTASIA